MIGVLDGPIGKLGSEIRANRRLQVGLGLIGGILVFYAVLVLFELRRDQEAGYVQRREQLQKMRKLAGQDVWIGRAKGAARVRRGLAAEIPEVETVGVAQAQLTSWVSDVAQAFGGSGVQIQSQAAQQVAGTPDVWRIPVVLSGTSPPGRLLDLIRQVERRSVLTVIEQAMLVNRENRAYSLTVVAYVQVGRSSPNVAP